MINKAKQNDSAKDLFQTIAEKAILIRQDICQMTNTAGSGHPGGSLSIADIMAVLYFGDILHYNARNPQDPERDFFILSKGHAAPALYAVLAEAGFIARKTLSTLRKLGSSLQGHPDKRSVPGVEMSTGSLGQGLSVSVGLALSLKMDKKANRVFCLMGDGELQEGQVWEAAMSAAHYGVDNLVAIVDRNSLQIDGPTEQVMALGNINAKFAAFGWDVICVDGHDYPQLVEAFTFRPVSGKPLLVLANTTKGKGVSFMENNLKFHGTAPTNDECTAAICELRKS